MLDGSYVPGELCGCQHLKNESAGAICLMSVVGAELGRSAGSYSVESHPLTSEVRQVDNLAVTLLNPAPMTSEVRQIGELAISTLLNPIPFTSEALWRMKTATGGVFSK